MNKIGVYLGCGKVGKIRADQCCNLVISKFSDIYDIIIPFFDKYKLRGAKALNFELFKEGAVLVKNKGHLSVSGLTILKEIRAKINK